jgi:hypothetical protein
MQISVQQMVIGALVVIGFFGSFIVLLFVPNSLNDLNREPVMLMIGCLVSGFSGLLGFFFGSTAGSTRKTEIMAKVLGKDPEFR